MNTRCMEYLKEDQTGFVLFVPTEQQYMSSVNYMLDVHSLWSMNFFDSDGYSTIVLSKVGTWFFSTSAFRTHARGFRQTRPPSLRRGRFARA